MAASSPAGCRRRLRCVGRYMWWYRDQLFTILIPLVLLPIPLAIPGQEALCGYVLLVMATYWVTHCISLFFTGMIPVFTFTLMGILTPAQVAEQYLNDSMMLLLGSIMCAISFETTCLHKRLALGILNLISPRPEWLLFGIILTTWFLSMWITNTATIAMMMAIVEALVDQMEELKRVDVTKETSLLEESSSNILEISGPETFDNPGQSDDDVFHVQVCNGAEANGVAKSSSLPSHKEMSEKEGQLSMTQLEPRMENAEPEIDSESHDQKRALDGQDQVDIKYVIEAPESPEEETNDTYIKSVSISLTLAVCYASKIGGMATLTGSGINLIVKDYIDMYYAERGHESPINFNNWMMMLLPLSFLSVILCHLWLQGYHIGARSLIRCFKRESLDEFGKSLRTYIHYEYKSLGSMRYCEVVVATLFSILVLLWFFRDPGFMPGWASFFPDGYTSDSIPAVMMAFVMFFIPINKPWQKIQKTDGSSKPPTILNWSMVHKKIPWGALLLIGGGRALGAAVVESGLSDWIGNIINWMEDIPHVVLVFLLIFLCGLLTECLTPATICALFITPVGMISESFGRSPMYLQMAVGVGSFLAFMLPSSSVGTAMVFGYGRLTVMDMVKAGFALNVLCSFAGLLAITTWGYAIYDMGTIPWDTTSTNVTMTTLDSLINQT